MPRRNCTSGCERREKGTRINQVGSSSKVRQLRSSFKKSVGPTGRDCRESAAENGANPTEIASEIKVGEEKKAGCP